MEVRRGTAGNNPKPGKRPSRDSWRCDDSGRKRNRVLNRSSHFLQRVKASKKIPTIVKVSTSFTPMPRINPSQVATPARPACARLRRAMYSPRTAPQTARKQSPQIRKICRREPPGPPRSQPRGSRRRAWRRDCHEWPLCIFLQFNSRQSGNILANSS